jgi:hypothetical protein
MVQTIFNNSNAIAWPEAFQVLPVVVIDASILLVLGQPFITIGMITLAVGIAAGILKNTSAFGSFGEPPRPQPIGRLDVRVPVMLLLTEEQIAKIDQIVRTGAMRSNTMWAGRRRFIMSAVDEKLARADASNWPLVA